MKKEKWARWKYKESKEERDQGKIKKTHTQEKANEKKKMGVKKR